MPPNTYKYPLCPSAGTTVSSLWYPASNTHRSRLLLASILLLLFVAATNNAAHVCNLEEIIGTLEPGKITDILVVAEDPLKDIQALADVQMVVHNGVIIRE